jgi:hypothetical protein
MGLLPAPDALSRLSVLPDPYAPDRKLLIWVTTLAKKMSSALTSATADEC